MTLNARQWRLIGWLARSARALLCAAVLIWPLALQAEDSLQGRFLVASPSMPDPYFAKTVIYMLEHDAIGAMGLIVNKPLGSIDYAAVFAGLGLDNPAIEGAFDFHRGGPVERRSLFVLHTPDVLLEGSETPGGPLALTIEPEILKKIATGAGPRRHLVVLGYSGWGPGQLEAEMEQGGWENVTFDEKLVFDMDDERKWDAALQRQEIPL